MAKPKKNDLATIVAAGGLWVWHNRERIREVLKSEQVAQALKTPQAQQVLSSPTARRVIEHPQVRALMDHPEFQRWLNGQQPAAPAQGPQEAYTGETRRLD